MKKNLSLLLLTAVAFALVGCAAASGSRLQKSGDAFDSFMKRRVLPGHRYFTTGPQNTPDAIVALKEGYTISGGRWTERKMSPTTLDGLVRQMNDLYGAVNVGLSGSDILDDSGNTIGIWYSAVSTTQVKMVSSTEVFIEAPNQVYLDELKVRMRG